jgi:catechol 2,3-dioxygenase-like lactoylglutathione lyase family enzyme
MAIEPLVEANQEEPPMTTTNVIAPQDANELKSPFVNLHHVAMVTNDMEKTVAFYRDVLGSEIAMAHRTGSEDVRHYFITVAPNTVFAFFEFQDAEMPELLPATQRKSGRSLDHICLWVEDEQAWDDFYDHIVSQGIDVTRSEERKSMFFPDPNNIVIEVTIANWRAGYPIHDDPDPAYDPPAN